MVNHFGSIENEECRIDSISQSWGVISNAADNDKKYISIQSLENHLIDTENGLHSALDNRRRVNIGDTRAYSRDYLVDKAVALVLVQIKQTLDFLAAERVKITYGDTLHFLLDVAHTEAVSNGSIDIHSFQSGISLLVCGTEMQRPHIMQTVCKLYDDNTNVL